MIKHLNKKVTSNKTKNVEIEKKTTDLTNKVEKRYDFLLGRTYFTGNFGYPNFLAFAQMLSSLILDRNKKVTNWISTGI